MAHTAAIAAKILKAHDAGATIERISDTDAPFEVADAYRVSTALATSRIARGAKPLGWKIGYTNRAVQQKYGVLHPIWGRMYDATVAEIPPGGTATCELAHIAEPRIEPEIVVRISRPPNLA